jgi:hypothetical protein
MHENLQRNLKSKEITYLHNLFLKNVDEEFRDKRLALSRLNRGKHV